MNIFIYFKYNIFVIMKKFYLFISFIVLLTLVHTQKGGGSSSRSSSSGSSSSGSRSSFSTYSSPSYSSTSYTSYNSYGGYGGYGGYSSGTPMSSTTGIIIGCVFGGIFLVIIIVIIICCCCRKNETDGNGQIQGDMIAQRQAVRQQYFNAQKIARNNVCLTNMSEDEFEFYRNYFQTNKWKFYYIQYNQRHDIVHYGIQMTKIAPFLYSLFIQGTDELGNWTINGFYLNTVRGIQWWGMKNYDHPDYAGQTQEWDKLMYEGAITRDRNYYGKWYFVGFESNPQYSADWFMQTVRI